MAVEKSSDSRPRAGGGSQQARGCGWSPPGPEPWAGRVPTSTPGAQGALLGVCQAEAARGAEASQQATSGAFPGEELVLGRSDEASGSRLLSSSGWGN